MRMRILLSQEKHTHVDPSCCDTQSHCHVLPLWSEQEQVTLPSSLVMHVEGSNF